MVVPSMTQIAVVEDDPAVAETLGDMLEGEGYRTFRCSTGRELSALMARERLNLILLDLKLPDCDGLALAAQIRATERVPIIILTGKGSEIDRIVGLEIGADDYVVKPFSVREVAARIRAVLRRTHQLPESQQQSPPPRRGYQFDRWTLDLDRRRLFDPQGQAVPLSVAEFDLLSAVVAARGRVLTRTQLLELTRRESDDVFDRTIDVLVLRLRRKIEPNPQQPTFLVTERGIGYVFTPKVESFGFD